MTFRVMLDPQLFSVDSLSPRLLNKLTVWEKRLGLHFEAFGLCDYIAVQNSYKLRAKKNAERLVLSLIRRLADYPTNGGEQAHLNGIPVPDLSDHWGCALLTCLTAEDSCWRDPAIITSRRDDWPPGDEVSIGPDELLRVIVAVEDTGQHPYFFNDYDPWRLVSINEPSEKVSEKRAPLRRLPKPREFENKPMSEWGAILRDMKAQDWKQGDRRYYIPDKKNWKPVDLAKPEDKAKKDWRNHKMFPTGKLNSNERGFRDKGKRIWRWDPSGKHNDHWDVQKPDGSNHVNVNSDGIIRILG